MLHFMYYCILHLVWKQISLWPHAVCVHIRETWDMAPETHTFPEWCKAQMIAVHFLGAPMGTSQHRHISFIGFCKRLRGLLQNGFGSCVGGACAYLIITHEQSHYELSIKHACSKENMQHWRTLLSPPSIGPLDLQQRTLVRELCKHSAADTQGNILNANCGSSLFMLLMHSLPY